MLGMPQHNATWVVKGRTDPLQGGSSRVTTWEHRHGDNFQRHALDVGGPWDQHERHALSWTSQEWHVVLVYLLLWVNRERHRELGGDFSHDSHLTRGRLHSEISLYSWTFYQITNALHASILFRVYLLQDSCQNNTKEVFQTGARFLKHIKSSPNAIAMVLWKHDMVMPRRHPASETNPPSNQWDSHTPKCHEHSHDYTSSPRYPLWNWPPKQKPEPPGHSMPSLCHKDSMSVRDLAAEVNGRPMHQQWH